MSVQVEWAVTSSLLILAVVLVRAVLGRHIGAGLRYALWGLVLLRLLIPVQLFAVPGPGPVLPAMPEGAGPDEAEVSAPAEPAGDSGRFWVDGQTVPVITLGPDGRVRPPLTVGNGAAAEPPAPVGAEEIRVVDLTALGWIWLAGAALAGLVLLGCNVRFALSLARRREGLDVPDFPLPVYAARDLPSPCLFGLLRPAVYIDPALAREPVRLRHVLVHEETHARHGDHLWSLLRCAALCIHWWNPLVWLAAALSRRDGELACDEGALKRLGDAERGAYGRTVLSVASGGSSSADLLRCATTMSGGKRALWERVSRIAQAPRRLVWAAALAVLIAVAVTLCAFVRTGQPGGNFEVHSVGFTGSDPAEGYEVEPFSVELALPEGWRLAPRGEESFAAPDGLFGAVTVLDAEGTPVGCIGYAPAQEAQEDAPMALFAGLTLSKHAFDCARSYREVSRRDGLLVATADVIHEQSANDTLSGHSGAVNPGILVRSEELGVLVGIELDGAAADSEAVETIARSIRLTAAAGSPAPAASEGAALSAQVNGKTAALTLTGGEGEQTVTLSYDGGQARFEDIVAGDWWIDLAGVDLDGDGREEIAVMYSRGHGTGAQDGAVRVFDSDTLAELGGAAVAETAIGQIRSAADGENYYLSAPGMDVTVLKKSLEADGEQLLDTLAFGDYVWFHAKDGGLYCDLGAEFGFTFYCGTVRVELGLEEGELACRSFRYIPSQDAYAPEYAWKAYEDVLNGLTGFIFMADGEAEHKTVLDIPALFGSGGGDLELRRYALVDTDRDGADEMVVCVCGADGGVGGYLVLSSQAGQVYGYDLGCRDDIELRADGVYFRYDPQGGYRACRLDREGKEVLVAARVLDDGLGGSGPAYVVEGERAGREAFEAAYQQELAQPLAEWQELDTAGTGLSLFS